MYKIYFDNRCIEIYELNLKNSNRAYILCKNKKSFDIVYKDFLKDKILGEIKICSSHPDKLFKHLKKKFKTIKAAGGLVINQDNELLVIKRNGLWDLPKGKVEKNETRKVAAIREIEEECGLKNLELNSKIGKTYHTYQFNEQEIFKTTHWYRITYNGNDIPVPQTEENITAVKWVKKNEINSILENTYESLKSIILTYK